MSNRSIQKRDVNFKVVYGWIGLIQYFKWPTSYVNENKLHKKLLKKRNTKTNEICDPKLH